MIIQNTCKIGKFYSLIKSGLTHPTVGGECLNGIHTVDLALCRRGMPKGIHTRGMPKGIHTVDFLIWRWKPKKC